jgi:hypothetical protein
LALVQVQVQALVQGLALVQVLGKAWSLVWSSA